MNDNDSSHRILNTDGLIENISVQPSVPLYMKFKLKADDGPYEAEIKYTQGDLCVYASQKNKFPNQE
jgi:hypothetical protein